MNLVYDLASQPFSIGDLLTQQQASLLMGHERIDVTVAYDPKRMAVTSAFNWLLPAARVNPRLGEAGLKTHAESEAIAGEIWPPKGSRYMFYQCFEMIAEHYEEFGSIPALRPLPGTREWAERYLERHGRTTIQLRRNVANPRRNSDYGAWCSFVSRHPDEKFVVVCAPHESDKSLRLPNVTFACDEVGVDTEKICALVEASDFHLGACSGPLTMRLCSEKPFAAWKDGHKPGRVKCLQMGPKGNLYPWTVDGQFLYSDDETADSIDRAFDAMREAVMA